MGGDKNRGVFFGYTERPWCGTSIRAHTHMEHALHKPVAGRDGVALGARIYIPTIFVEVFEGCVERYGLCVGFCLFYLFSVRCLASRTISSSCQAPERGVNSLRAIQGLAAILNLILRSGQALAHCAHAQRSIQMR